VPWTRTGQGSVSACLWPPDGLLWEELGIWWEESGEIVFHNQLLWRHDRRAGKLQLERVRPGADSPIRLATFVATGSEHLRCFAPHRCVADTYAPALVVSEVGIELNWEVRGPAKRYILTSLYS